MNSNFRFGFKSSQNWLALVVCLAALWMFPLATAAADSESFATSLPASTVDLLKQIGKDFAAGSPVQKVTLKLPTKSGLISARISPHDIRTKNYRAQISGPSGVVPDPVHVDLFTGFTGEQGERGFARLAVVSNLPDGSEQLKGLISVDGVFYAVNSVDTFGEELLIQEISDEDLQAIAASCGVQAKHQHTNSEVVVPRGTGGDYHAEATYRLTQIATDADFEYTQALGGGSQANAEILSIINGIDAVYRAQVGVGFTVSFQNAFTNSNDPYTSSDASALLDQFTNHWNSNFAPTVTYDLAHFWTGRDLNGGTVGIAWLGAVCYSVRYGLSQRLGGFNTSLAVTAHEIGHNFNAVHDGSGSAAACGGGFLMEAFLNGSTDFSTCSRTAIATFLPSATCLDTLDDGTGGGNTAPVLGTIGPQTVTEGQTLQFAVSATDLEGDAISYSASALPVGATFTGQTFRYVPALSTVPANQSSTTVSAVFTAADIAGLTDSETVTITVANQNQTPVLVSPGTVNLTEGQLGNIQFVASDGDGDSLIFVAANLPAGATFDAQTGQILWRPSGSQSGSYTIDVAVRDSFGAVDVESVTVIVANNVSAVAHPLRHALGDFDGDGGAEVVVYRGTLGNWYSDEFGGSSLQTVQFGLPGDVPVPADYNGDNISDRAVFRPSVNTWFISYSGTGMIAALAFGLSGDLPAPGDYDGDGRDDLAIYRPSYGQYIYLRSSDGVTHVVTLIGGVGDLPVPCDYDGDGRTDIAVWRPSNGTWTIVESQSSSTTVVQHGTRSDFPVAADYNGDAQCEVAVWRPADGNWFVYGASQPTQFGLGGDVPLPSDLDGDGDADLLVWRPFSALWFRRNSNGSASQYQLGLPSDIIPAREALNYALRNSANARPSALRGEASSVLLYAQASQTLYSASLSGTTSASVAATSGSSLLRGDWDGDTLLDTVVFNAGVWSLRLGSGGTQTLFWGRAGDQPLSADFDGDGKSDLAVWRTETGEWFIVRSSDGILGYYQWGLSGDVPIPADYNGDGWSDPAVWRPASGTWYMLDSRSGKPIEITQWGLPGDVPRAFDLDRDGRADKTVWRESSGTWFTLPSGGGINIVQWGLPGDVPVPGTYFSSSAVDYAVYRPSVRILFVLSTTGQQRALGLNVPADATVVGYPPF